MTESSIVEEASSTYVTEPNYQTLPKRLLELCKEMDGIVQRASSRFQGSLDAQRLRFFKAFKNVVEQVLEEFSELQKKFEEYIAYSENESQHEALQKKLIFFRTECQAQQHISMQYKRENQSLKAQLEELKNENRSQHSILMKQMNEKLQLQAKLDDLMRPQIKKLQIVNTVSLPTSQNQKRTPKQLNIEDTHTQVDRGSTPSKPRTVFIQQEMEQVELKQIWKECVCQAKLATRSGNVDPLQPLLNFLKGHQTLESIVFKNQQCCSHPECPMNFHQKLERMKTFHSESFGETSFNINPRMNNLFSTSSSDAKHRKHKSYDLKRYQNNYANLNLSQNEPANLQKMINLYQIELSNLKSHEKDLSNTRVIIEQIRIKKAIAETQDKLKQLNKQINNQSE